MSEEMKKKVHDYYQAYYELTPVTNLLEDDVQVTYEELPITLAEWKKKKEEK